MKQMFAKISARTNLAKGSPTLEEATWVENLTTMALDYTQNADNFAHTVTPIIPIQTPQGKYKVFSKADAFRTEAGPRRPGAEAPTRDTAVAEQTYLAVCQSVKTSLADEVRDAKDSVLDDARKTREVMRDLVIRRELDWLAAYFVTATWANNVAGTTDFVKWDAANATIVTNVNVWKSSVHLGTGIEVTDMVLANDVYDKIIEDSEIRDYLASVVTASGTDDPKAIKKANLNALAVIFGIPNIKVAKAFRNTAAEGLTATMAYMASDQVLLMANAPNGNPSVEEPSASYCGSWAPYDNVDADVAKSGSASIKSWYENKTGSTWFQGDMYYKFFIPDTGAGLFATDVLT